MVVNPLLHCPSSLFSLLVHHEHVVMLLQLSLVVLRHGQWSWRFDFEQIYNSESQTMVWHLDHLRCSHIVFLADALNCHQIKWQQIFHICTESLVSFYNILLPKLGLDMVVGWPLINTEINLHKMTRLSFSWSWHMKLLTTVIIRASVSKGIGLNSFSNTTPCDVLPSNQTACNTSETAGPCIYLDIASGFYFQKDVSHIWNALNETRYLGNCTGFKNPRVLPWVFLGYRLGYRILYPRETRTRDTGTWIGRGLMAGKLAQIWT